MNPLFVLGKQKTLEQADVPDIYIKDSATFLSEAFDEDLKKVKEEHGLQNSSQGNLYVYSKKGSNQCMFCYG